jgi:putative redox protein
MSGSPSDYPAGMAAFDPTVVVEETGVDPDRGTSRMTQEVRAFGHELLADEPVDHGGADLGPPPFGWLLSALGACTAMTVRLYADRKAWPLERVRVELAHETVSGEGGASVLLVHRHLELVGDLDDEQRERLVAIAGKCPVHRALTGEIRVETTLA